MRKIIAGTVIAVTLILGSCQKEIDWGTGNTNMSTGPMLIRIKSQTGTDTTQIDYTYDASNRLIREKTAGIGAGQNLDNDFLIYRNSSGIITKTVQKAAALVLAGIDSVVTRYNYNTGSSRYTSSVFDIGIPGFSVTDSAVYSYDANGRITMDEHYFTIGGGPIPIPPILMLRDSYTYTGANVSLISQDAATTPGGPLDPVTTQAFTFDTKTNAMITGTEGIILTRPNLFNANNPKQLVLTDLATSTNSFTMDYTYKYNSYNKPDSSYGTKTPGGAVTATKYFYQ